MAAMASDSNSGAGGRSGTGSPTPTDADRIAELQESVKRIEVSHVVMSVVCGPEISGD